MGSWVVNWVTRNTRKVANFDGQRALIPGKSSSLDRWRPSAGQEERRQEYIWENLQFIIVHPSSSVDLAKMGELTCPNGNIYMYIYIYIFIHIYRYIHIYIYIVINLDHLCGVIPISSKLAKSWPNLLRRCRNPGQFAPSGAAGVGTFGWSFAGTRGTWNRQETGSWFQFSFKHRFHACDDVPIDVLRVGFANHQPVEDWQWIENRRELDRTGS